MRRERKQGLIYSVAAHVLFILLMVFGLPSLFKLEPPVEPAAITVELLPISALSNVKPSDGQQSEKPKQEEKESEQKKPSPPVKTSEAAPTPPEPTPTPEPKKPEPKPEPKPEEKKPEPKPEEKKPELKKEDKKPKPKEDDLAAILKAVKETAQKEKTDKKETKEKTSPSPKTISNRYDPSQQMSISEKDAIMSQLAANWSINAGAKNAQDLVVIIDAEFSQDGKCLSAKLSDKSRSRYDADPAFRAAADAAVRAVWKSSPLKNLSPEKYDTWKYMELHFDPREMLL